MKALRTLALLTAGLLGCAPSLGRLLQTRSYADAMCLLDKKEPDEHARQLLLRKLAEDSAQTIRIDVVDPVDFARTHGPVAAELSKKLVIVRLGYALPNIAQSLTDAQNSSGRIESSAVRVIADAVGVALAEGDKPLPQTPAARPRLLALTGEKAPAPHEEAGRSPRRSGPLSGLAALVVAPFELLGAVVGGVAGASLKVATLGQFKSPFPNYKPMQVTESLLRDSPGTPSRIVQPTATEYHQAAPVAEAVAQLGEACQPSSWSHYNERETTTGCALALIERPAAETSAPLTLRLRFAYGVGQDSKPSCPISTELALQLPAGPTLEARIQAAVPPGPHLLAELLAH